MKSILVGLTAASILACGAASLQAQGAGGRSSWSGVFTAAQAERGHQLFNANCAKCHGESLAGDEMAPQLAGPNFLSNWNGENVGDLVDRIHSTMPADDPGKLSAAQATDIATFILSANQMPAGAAELPRDQQVQQQIRIDGLNPAAK
jgi:S-disulfanyl-L-cysteine oxidoreductase SoxD